MDDNTKKIGQLFWRLNAGEVSAGVIPKLQQLCMAIENGDWHTANHIQVAITAGLTRAPVSTHPPVPSDWPAPLPCLSPQVQMTTTDWDECGFWLSAVKRLVKLRQLGH